MSYFVKDNLQGYAPGSGFMSGWYANGIVFVSEFVEASSIAEPPGFNTFWERPGIIYELFGNAAYPTLASTGSTLTSDSSIFWATLGTGGTGPIMVSLYNASPVPTPGAAINVLSMVLQPDASISITAPGATPVNTLLPYYFANVWMYFQLEVSCGSYTSGGQTFLSIQVALAINGETVISGVTMLTNLIVANLPSGTPQISQWGIENAQLGTSFLGEIAFTNDLQPFPTWPFPASVVNMRISGVNSELIKAPSSRNMRVSGFNSELIKAPSNRNMRLSQLVVEVIRKTSSSGGVLPEYVKSHNWPGSN